MMPRLHRAVLIGCLAAAACNLPDKICEVDEKDNTCSGPSDCVTAYCAADCTVCPAVYSTKQVGEAWCLTPLDRDPQPRCVKAAESVCTPSSLPSICPRYITPVCEEGKCAPDFTAPPDG